MHRRAAWFAAAVAFALSPIGLALLRGADEPEKPPTFTGKVVPLSEVLPKAGSRLDADAAPYWLALVTEDGKVYPIIKDDGGRRFFKDERLRNRPLQVTGRTVKNTSLLQVLSVHSLKDGKPHEIFYWCDICAIKRHELNACECCGGPMELREVPVEE